MLCPVDDGSVRADRPADHRCGWGVLPGGPPGDTFSGCLHLVRAWATENKLILGQVAVAEGSHEIAAIPEFSRFSISRGRW